MPTYVTKQRKILLKFLDEHADEIFSTAQLIDYFALENISASAVYRNLSELESTGEIRRLNKIGTREAYYQYVNAESCKNQIHLFCLKCEKFVHMNKFKATGFINQILEDEDFVVDKNNTVIYGVCKNCR